MPKVTPEHFAERKAQLLDGCVRVFARSGFHQTSMRDLCSQLAVSAGGFYTYFASKEEIIQAMAERDRQHLDQFFAQLNPDTSFADTMMQMTAFAEEQAITAQEVNSVWLQINAEATTNATIRTLVTKHVAFVNSCIEKLVKKAQTRGELGKTLPASVYATFILAAFDGLMMRIATDSAANPKKMLKDFTRIITSLTQIGGAA
jgi:TetR/AcrR family transcriptional regulator, repressor for uid operon